MTQARHRSRGCSSADAPVAPEHARRKEHAGNPERIGNQQVDELHPDWRKEHDVCDPDGELKDRQRRRRTGKLIGAPSEQPRLV